MKGLARTAEQWVMEGPEPQGLAQGIFGQNPLLHQLRANECNNKLCYFLCQFKQGVAGTGGGGFWDLIFFAKRRGNAAGA